MTCCIAKMRCDHIQDTIQDASGGRQIPDEVLKYSGYNSGAERGRKVQEEAQKMLRIHFMMRAEPEHSGLAGTFRIRHESIQDIMQDASGAVRFKMRQ